MSALSSSATENLYSWQVQVYTMLGWKCVHACDTEYSAHMWRVLTTANSHLLDEQTTRIVKNEE